MKKQSLTQTQQQVKKLLTPIKGKQLSFSPDNSPQNKPSKQLVRKGSLIELNRIEEGVKMHPLIAKDPKMKLFSQQKPRNCHVQLPRVDTSEGQCRGFEFTFAQHFSNKQSIPKEFSAFGLRKKFFA